MKWIDYREKLGIGFSDSDKAKMLANNVATFIKNSALNSSYTTDDYYRFCLMTGTPYSMPYPETQGLYLLFSGKKLSIPQIISHYVAFVNTQNDATKIRKKTLMNALGKFLEDLNIQYELLNDKDGYFLFPKGATELDDALVSQPLEWLKDYPKSHKTYCTALRQYSDGIFIRDVADNLRKTLEGFLQEFLCNDKNLETNKNEICKYLGAQGIDAGISGLFQPLINAYKNINDRIAKHNDRVDKKMLEFLLYQTGVLIRMVLVVKQAEMEEPTDTD